MSLEHLLTDLHSRSNQAKGDAFEQLCRWFLSNDPIYSRQVRRVWHFKEWEDNWGSDTGTDLIVETKEGQIWAVQAKAYGADKSITKASIDSF